ncbi:glycosyltransferase [Desulfosporosinus sp. OT]|uniref:glycosyltransferase n=1 Tax=Desulfosporosinus sp. OT TaxID=913865 RepID=UPI000223A322|nr:glycosyltransferase [Desulfosporosinus sp. OT]EGW37819.1 glycosyltransferase family 28 C-terminal domain protein [Desulfosporosinus sp. OT]
MIFVTVGTHEQPFNRLIQCIDKMKEKGAINKDVIMQTGFCTYEPKYCQWSKLYPYQEMIKNVNNARIVITHGGPSSFIMPLQLGKIPIVVPRMKQYGEHINNHQVEFTNAVVKRQGNIIVVEQMDELEQTILNYDTIAQNMPARIKSNNAQFNDEFKKMVESIFGK